MNTNNSLVRVFNEEKGFVEDLENTIVFNDDYTYPLDIENTGVRWIIVGEPGSGKSWLLTLAASQFRNVILFDPSRGLRKTLAAQYGTVFGGKAASKLANDWEFLELTKSRKQNRFAINTSDLGTRILDIVFPYSTGSNQKMIRQRQVLDRFLRSSFQNKTYKNLQQLCKDFSMQHVFEDLKLILDPKDSAPSIEDLCMGRKVVECEGISERDRNLGVFVQSVVNSRSNWSEKDCFNPNNFLIIGMDEAQDYAKTRTPLGESLARYGREARKFGLGSIMCGAGYDSIHFDIRAKYTLAFLYQSKTITEKYRKGTFDLALEDWDKLPKYGCFVYDRVGEYAGGASTDFFVPSFVYFDRKKPENEKSNRKSGFRINFSIHNL